MDYYLLLTTYYLLHSYPPHGITHYSLLTTHYYLYKKIRANTWRLFCAFRVFRVKIIARRHRRTAQTLCETLRLCVRRKICPFVLMSKIFSHTEHTELAPRIYTYLHGKTSHAKAQRARSYLYFCSYVKKLHTEITEIHRILACKLPRKSAPSA